MLSVCSVVEFLKSNHFHIEGVRIFLLSSVIEWSRSFREKKIRKIFISNYAKLKLNLVVQFCSSRNRKNPISSPPFSVRLKERRTGAIHEMVNIRTNKGDEIHRRMLGEGQASEGVFFIRKTYRMFRFRSVVTQGL
jgi:hypothetical protein